MRVQSEFPSPRLGRVRVGLMKENYFLPVCQAELGMISRFGHRPGGASPPAFADAETNQSDILR